MTKIKWPTKNHWWQSDILAESGKIVGHRLAACFIFEATLRLFLLHYAAVSLVCSFGGCDRRPSCVVLDWMILHVKYL